MPNCNIVVIAGTVAPGVSKKDAVTRFEIDFPQKESRWQPASGVLRCSYAGDAPIVPGKRVVVEGRLSNYDRNTYFMEVTAVQEP